MQNLQLGGTGISELVEIDMIEADVCLIGEFEAYRNHRKVERLHPYELSTTTTSANVKWILE